jgi:hypothetical protein
VVNKPEQNSPDPSANDDDEAVWLDLVARLEATSSGLPETGRRRAFTDFDPLGVSRPADRGNRPSGTPPSPSEVPRDGMGFESGSRPRHRGPEDGSGLGGLENRPGLGGVENGAGFGGRDDGAGFGAVDDRTGFGGPRDYAGDDDDDECIPEEPPSLANVEPAIMLAWVGALGAPVGLLLAAMLWRDAPLTAIFGLVAVFLICAGYLIFRLPATRGEDDDDGAVV